MSVPSTPDLADGASPPQRPRRLPVDPDSVDKWLTKDGAARYLSVSAKSVQRLVAAKQFPAFRVGRSLRLRRSDLDLFLARSQHVESASPAVEVAPSQPDDVRAHRAHPSDRALFDLGRQAHNAGIQQIFKSRMEDPTYKVEFVAALNAVREGGRVRIMSNSLRFLLGPQPDMTLYIPMWDALKRGVTFQLLLLDPFSDAAITRARVEERAPVTDYYATHLYRDIIGVAGSLADPDPDWIRDETLRNRLKNPAQVLVRFSSSAPTTHLMLTDDVCFVENYHTGGDHAIQDSLLQMGVPNLHCFGGFITTFLYDTSCLAGRLLETHFEHSWEHAGEHPTVHEVLEAHRKLQEPGPRS